MQPLASAAEDAASTSAAAASAIRVFMMRSPGGSKEPGISNRRRPWRFHYLDGATTSAILWLDGFTIKKPQGGADVSLIRGQLALRRGPRCAVSSPGACPRLDRG